MILWLRAHWVPVLLGMATAVGLLGGLAWAIRPRTETETAQLARRELQEAIRQLDLFLQTYPTTPDEARGALQRARSAFDQAAGHLALTRPVEVRQSQADFQRLQDRTASRAAPEEVLPLARRLREALQRLMGAE
ncbi:MAG: hypothetical protein NZM16_08065 [Thermoflexus sp.]|uniref:hypothetical protein n=1 Tax=Thermoflexus sp. TaxID=1969742 RepID=UPI0025EA264D|nr:hypothetical protein [Thermoflexus sp.]MCS6963987.1 hypothetical protein [Thermoflexus sp.]MDW8186103.1 hypothetical protein [Anaerolineae bacterium]